MKALYTLLVTAILAAPVTISAQVVLTCIKTPGLMNNAVVAEWQTMVTATNLKCGNVADVQADLPLFNAKRPALEQFLQGKNCTMAQLALNPATSEAVLCTVPVLTQSKSDENLLSNYHVDVKYCMHLESQRVAEDDQVYGANGVVESVGGIETGLRTSRKKTPKDAIDGVSLSKGAVNDFGTYFGQSIKEIQARLRTCHEEEDRIMKEIGDFERNSAPIESTSNELDKKRSELDSLLQATPRNDAAIEAKRQEVADAEKALSKAILDNPWQGDKRAKEVLSQALEAAKSIPVAEMTDAKPFLDNAQGPNVSPLERMRNIWRFLKELPDARRDTIIGNIDKGSKGPVIIVDPPYQPSIASVNNIAPVNFNFFGTHCVGSQDGCGLHGLGFEYRIPITGNEDWKFSGIIQGGVVYITGASRVRAQGANIDDGNRVRPFVAGGVEVERSINENWSAVLKVLGTVQPGAGVTGMLAVRYKVKDGPEFSCGPTFASIPDMNVPAGKGYYGGQPSRLGPIGNMGMPFGIGLGCSLRLDFE